VSLFYRCPTLARARIAELARLLFAVLFIGTRVVSGAQPNDIGANGNSAGPFIRQLTAADYARAEKVLDFNLKSSVKNAHVEAHWLSGQTAFWYQCQTSSGMKYILVDASNGAKKPLFDEQRLITSIFASAPKSRVTPAHLNLNVTRSNRIMADGWPRLVLAMALA
jgi:hypothetical protein